MARRKSKFPNEIKVSISDDHLDCLEILEDAGDKSRPELIRDALDDYLVTAEAKLSAKKRLLGMPKQGRLTSEQTAVLRKTREAKSVLDSLEEEILDL